MGRRSAGLEPTLTPVGPPRCSLSRSVARRHRPMFPLVATDANARRPSLNAPTTESIRESTGMTAAKIIVSAAGSEGTLPPELSGPRRWYKACRMTRSSATAPRAGRWSSSVSALNGVDQSVEFSHRYEDPPANVNRAESLVVDQSVDRGPRDPEREAGLIDRERHPGWRRLGVTHPHQLHVTSLTIS